MDVGEAITMTMIYNIIWPLIEFCIFAFIRKAARVWDRRWSCKEQTRKTWIYAYRDLYAGPEYFLHYKYSAILNIAFITFAFGAGIPILFPIALASFIIIYFLERILLAKYYRQPPLFDETLNRLAI
jgi:hypothetical protein